jgi:hypothetical protein
MASMSSVAAARAATHKYARSRKRVPALLARLRSDAEFFESLKSDLLGRPELADTFVAVYKRQMVGSDPDELTLFRRMTAKYGDVPFFIGRVERHSRIKRIPSPRVFRRAP